MTNAELCSLSQAEADNALPEGWQWVALGSVAELVSGAGFPTELQGQKGLPFPFFKVGSLGAVDAGEPLVSSPDTVDESTAGRLRARVIPPGSVLFAKIGMAIRLNRRRPAGVPCCIDNNLMAAVPSPEVEPRFLLRFLETVDLFPLSQATTVPSIRKTDIEQIPFPLPPLPEQRSIVAKVEALLARVNAARARLARVPAILKHFRQSVLAAACSGRLTEDWRAERPTLGSAAAVLAQVRSDRALFRPRRDRNVADASEWIQPEERELPDEWAWVRLSEVLHPDRAAAYGVLQPGGDLENGVPMVRVCDIQDGRVFVGQLKRIARPIDAQYPRTRLTGGEVLVSLVGTIGRVAVVPPEASGANVARAVAMLPLCPQQVEPHYVAHCLAEPTKNAQLVDLAREVARKTLNLGLLKAVEIPLAPLAEQNEIVRRIEALFTLADTIVQRAATALHRADRLTQSILSMAFRGDLLGVPSDVGPRTP